MRRLLPPWRIRPELPVGDFVERIADEFGGYEGLTPSVPAPAPSGDALACIAELEEQLRSATSAAIQLAEEKAAISGELAALKVRAQGIAAYAARLEVEAGQLRAAANAGRYLIDGTQPSPELVALRRRAEQDRRNCVEMADRLAAAEGRSRMAGPLHVVHPQMSRP